MTRRFNVTKKSYMPDNQFYGPDQPGGAIFATKDKRFNGGLYCIEILDGDKPKKSKKKKSKKKNKTKPVKGVNAAPSEPAAAPAVSQATSAPVVEAAPELPAISPAMVIAAANKIKDPGSLTPSGQVKKKVLESAMNRKLSMSEYGWHATDFKSR